MKRLVTCPDTGHLEELEVAEDPVDGHILGVSSCSRFRPADHVQCDRDCVRRLNQRVGNVIARDRLSRPVRVKITGYAWVEDEGEHDHAGCSACGAQAMPENDERAD